MCYRLRTLLILLTVLPPMLAGAWFTAKRLITCLGAPEVETFLVGYTPTDPIDGCFGESKTE